MTEPPTSPEGLDSVQLRGNAGFVPDRREVTLWTLRVEWETGLWAPFAGAYGETLDEAIADDVVGKWWGMAGHVFSAEEFTKDSEGWLFRGHRIQTESERVWIE